MTNSEDYTLRDFTPYLLNIAAEATSKRFQRYYKARYGMLRTEWRVLFHLGSYGPLTARDICVRASLHKTKVSRAVVALEAKRILWRRTMEEDRRSERLCLTTYGDTMFHDLRERARAFDTELMAAFTEDERRVLRACLIRLGSSESRA